MLTISRKSVLWSYLEPDLRGLIQDGEILLDSAEESRTKISDFSYLVFPFSKAYEGFLKKLFVDLDMIREDEYYGDDIRIGRILNPGYIEEHGSVYKKVFQHESGGRELSDQLWDVWKIGRNQVFHYFPHNFRSLSLNEALEIIHAIINAMSTAVNRFGLK